MDSFEGRIGDIDDLLFRNRGIWHLDAISWMDYDDVCQHIRHHIYNKWDKWDQSRPFKPWCGELIRNQIRNIIRNNYGNFKRPCLGCPHYASENGCNLTKSGVQDESCDDFKKWFKGKKRKHDVKMPLSIEGRVLPHSVKREDSFDFDSSAENLHHKVKVRLINEKHKRIYHLLYVEEVGDAEIALEMGFSKEANSRTARYKQLDNLKKRFVEIAKEVLEEEDVFS